MTPHNVAFTIIRVIAALIVSVGAGGFLAFCIALISEGGDFCFVCPVFLFTSLFGLLLYISSDRAAKAKVARSSVAGRPTNLYICSFCGKNHAEVRKLIAGPGVNICNNCVTICKNLLDKEPKEGSQS